MVNFSSHLTNSESHLKLKQEINTGKFMFESKLEGTVTVYIVTKLQFESCHTFQPTKVLCGVGSNDSFRTITGFCEGNIKKDFKIPFYEIVSPKTK